MLLIAEIIVSLIVIGLILLQERGGGLGGLFGGGAGDTSLYQTRRGFSRVIFIGTIIAIAFLAILALLNLRFPV